VVSVTPAGRHDYR